MISIKPYPTVRLRKAKSSPRRKGYPWYYNDEIALDRRAKNIKPGEIIKIEDSDLGPMGLFSFNPNSKISARLFDLNLLFFLIYSSHLKQYFSYLEKLNY